MYQQVSLYLKLTQINNSLSTFFVKQQQEKGFL